MILYMKQKVFSWTDKFTVRDEQERDVYEVQGKLLSIGKKLFVSDMDGHEVASVQQKVLSLFPRFFLYVDGREIGQIVRAFTLLRPKYNLEGLPWVVTGDVMAHEYQVMDGDTEIMALHKKWFSWGDSYQLVIDDDRNALRCLCVALAIDATLAMQQASASSSSSSSSSSSGSGGDA